MLFIQMSYIGHGSFSCEKLNFSLKHPTLVLRNIVEVFLGSVYYRLYLHVKSSIVRYNWIFQIIIRHYKWMFGISFVFLLMFLYLCLLLLLLETTEGWFFERIYLYIWAVQSFNSWLIWQFLTNFVNTIFFHQWLSQLWCIDNSWQSVNLIFMSFKALLVIPFPPSPERYYDALRTKIDMWLSPKLTNMIVQNNALFCMVYKFHARLLQQILIFAFLSYTSTLTNLTWQIT